MCFLIKGEYNNTIVKCNLDIDLYCYETMPVLDDSDTPWYMIYHYENDLNKHFDALFEKFNHISKIKDIIDFYQNHFPDYAIPVLQKGITFKHVVAMRTVFTSYAELYNEGYANILIDVFHKYRHIGGLYYQMKNNNKKYCFDCLYNYYSKYQKDVEAFSYHELFCRTIPDVIYSSVEDNKYYCNLCQKFLFNVEPCDTVTCPTCMSLTIYEDIDELIISSEQCEIKLNDPFPITLTDFETDDQASN